MKRIYILSLLCCLCSLWGMAQQNPVLQQLSEMKGVSSMYISKAMFKLMSGTNMGGLNLGNYFQKLESIQIISCENADVIPQVKEAFRHVSVKNGYEELMRMTDDGSKAIIYWKEGNKKGQNEFVLLSDEQNDYTVIVIDGALTLEDMQQIASEKRESKKKE